MKVLDLQCQQGHVFEGWFGSEQDFQSQLTRGFVQCPLCGDAHISKRVTAARLNLSGAREALPGTAKAKAGAKAGEDEVVSQPSSQGLPGQANTASTASLAAHPGHMPPELQAAWLRMARHVMANTTDVGSDFAAEARRIHEGDAPERAIRGQATREETIELLEDGIAVLPLPLPQALKGTLQ